MLVREVDGDPGPRSGDAAPGGRLVARWVRASRDALAAARAQIDALNVYPVPDADTGTNLLLTVQAALEALEALESLEALEALEAGGPRDVPGALGADSAEPALRAAARGALLGARGSSGTILSGLLGGAADGFAATSGAAPTHRLARAFEAAADAGYAAVARPVEGTMLTVARAAAAAASAAADEPGAPVRWVVRAATRGAHEALRRTPQQLQALQEAGVVDAGGWGLVVVLDALHTTLTGWRPVPGAVRVLTSPARPAALPRVGARPPRPAPATEAVGPAYEVVYLLDAPDDRADDLRRTLDALGDSVVVVGGNGSWRVHAHVDDVGAAVEAGIEAGRPSGVRVVRFADPADSPPALTGPTRAAGAAGAAGAAVPAVPVRAAPATPVAGDPGRAVVAVAAGEGLARLYEAAGATAVTDLRGRPGVDRVLAAVRATGAGEVVLLPNAEAGWAVAETAAAQARDLGVRVAVVPTRAQVQGLAALAVHEPRRSFDEDVVAMTAAAGSTRHGAVTVADAEAVTSAGPCSAGDVLGAVEGDFVVIGTDVGQVAEQVAARMLAAGGELVTLVTGEGCSPAEAERVGRALREERPHLDVDVVAGGSVRYPLLVGVE